MTGRKTKKSFWLLVPFVVLMAACAHTPPPKPDIPTEAIIEATKKYVTQHFSQALADEVFEYDMVCDAMRTSVREYAVDLMTWFHDRYPDYQAYTLDQQQLAYHVVRAGSASAVIEMQGAVLFRQDGETRETVDAHRFFALIREGSRWLVCAQSPDVKDLAEY